MSEWIEFSLENPPEIGQDVWYFFEHTGVAQGKYIEYNTFGGKRGFLCGDVTHYILWEEGQEKPEGPIELVVRRHWFWKFMNQVHIEYSKVEDVLSITFEKTLLSDDFHNSDYVNVQLCKGVPNVLTVEGYLSLIDKKLWNDDMIMLYTPPQYIRNY